MERIGGKENGRPNEAFGGQFDRRYLNAVGDHRRASGLYGGMKHFKLQEFDCKCGCGSNNMQLYFLDMLERARTAANTPFVITSGFRCPAHNRKEGGKRNSDHLTGEGADIEIPNSRSRFIIVDSLILVGFKRIGIAKTFIHAGSRFDNPQKVIWLY